MQRVLVIGCGGAGKTEFAKRLAEKTNLPLIHLDRYYWNAGWVASDNDRWEERVRSLIEPPPWIMDGNYGSTLALRLQHADAVIFLDYPTITCITGIFRRLLTNREQTRPDMAPGCRERFDFEFFWYVVTFRRKQRPKILNALAHFTGNIHILATRRAATQFLASTTPNQLDAQDQAFRDICSERR